MTNSVTLHPGNKEQNLALMHQKTQGNLNNQPTFRPEDHPQVVDELQTIQQEIQHIPIYYKRDILISYLKNYCIKTDWIKENPILVKLLLGGYLKTVQVETLFSNNRTEKTFLKGFEDYIKARF